MDTKETGPRTLDDFHKVLFVYNQDWHDDPEGHVVVPISVISGKGLENLLSHHLCLKYAWNEVGGGNYTALGSRSTWEAELLRYTGQKRTDAEMTEFWLTREYKAKPGTHDLLGRVVMITKINLAKFVNQRVAEFVGPIETKQLEERTLPQLRAKLQGAHEKGRHGFLQAQTADDIDGNLLRLMDRLLVKDTPGNWLDIAATALMLHHRGTKEQAVGNLPATETLRAEHHDVLAKLALKTVVLTDEEHDLLKQATLLLIRGQS